MVDVNEYPALIRGDCKLDIIRALQGLPISTKNAVEDSKVIKVCCNVPPGHKSVTIDRHVKEM